MKIKQLLGALVVGAGLGRGMMAYPISSATKWWGVIGICFFTACLLTYLVKTYRWKALQGVGYVALFGVVVEFIGITTCLPYGCFVYSDLLGPQFLGTFPYVLLLIRPALVLLISQWIPERLPRWQQIALGTCMLVAVDLFMDPVLVAQGIWMYDPPGPWRGVPWSNFLGWIPVSAISVRLLWIGSREIMSDKILQHVSLVVISMYVAAFFMGVR